MSNLIEFQRKFRTNDLMLFEKEHWIWSLRPHQATVGAGILSLKRQCSRFSELTQSEACELGEMIKTIENSLAQILEYDVINYLMLMMFDKQVHFHVFPRYNKPVMVLGKEWKDTTWPGLVEVVGPPLAEEELHELRKLIREIL